jgi:hypothetical protein
MLRIRGALSVSVSVLAVSQLLFDPTGYAQAAPPDEPARPSPPVPPPARPIVTLRADSNKARLQLLGQDLTWQDVCVTPCNVRVSPVGDYRVGGGTIRPSETFSLPRQPLVVVDAKVGSTVKHGVGLGLIVGGAVTALAGVAVYTSADDRTDLNETNGPRIVAHIYGVLFMAVGAVLLAIGVPLSLSSTSVEVH